MRVREWVGTLAERLGLSEDGLLWAFIHEVLALPKPQLRELMKVDTRKPDRLTKNQVDIIVECLERASDRANSRRGSRSN